MTSNGRKWSTKKEGFSRKVLLSAIGASVLIIAGFTAILGSATKQSTAQNPSLTELANSLEQIHPKVTLSGEKISEVNGVALNQVGMTTTSTTTEWSEDGKRRPVSEDGQAQLTLAHAKSESGQDMLVGTVTNTGSKSFYLLGLTINGGTLKGPTPLGVDAVSAGWTPEVHPGLPQPPAIEPLIVGPGESVSASIDGRWTIPNTSTVIDTFEVGAIYSYDIQGVTTDEPVYNWSIGISNLKVQ
ncbi:MAG TPA: hypothetical protein VJP79_12410 [Nitrososphaera sp.]|nr:hypothetical protein [Nitrososphaera sp.]